MKYKHLLPLSLVEIAGTQKMSPQEGKSVIAGLVGLKPFVSRLEIGDSFGEGNYPLRAGSGIVSCGPITSKNPS
jgi:hypothetical protein